MAISYLNQYTLQGGTTSLTMIPPASSAAGDLDIIFVANKNSSVTPTNPSGGWTLLGQQAVGTGSDGVGTGQIMLTAWYRVLTGVSTSTSITITGANRSLGGGMIYRKAGGDPAWNPQISFGSDTSSGTSFTATVAANLGLAVGDYMLSVGVFTLNTTLPGRNQTIPGVTFTITGINSGGGATGNQIFLWTDHSVSSAGTQSGASATTATAGAATTGGAFNIRVGLSAGTAEGGAATTNATATATAVKVAIQSATCSASVSPSGIGAKRSPLAGRNLASATAQARAAKVYGLSGAASASPALTGRAVKVSPKVGLASARAFSSSAPRKVAVEKAQVSAASIASWLSVQLPHAVSGRCFSGGSVIASGVRVARASGVATSTEVGTGRATKKAIEAAAVVAASALLGTPKKRQPIAAAISAAIVARGGVVKVATLQGVAVTIVFVSGQRRALNYITPRPDIGTTARPTAGVTPRPQLGITVRPRVFT